MATTNQSSDFLCCHLYHLMIIRVNNILYVAHTVTVQNCKPSAVRLGLWFTIIPEPATLLKYLPWMRMVFACHAAFKVYEAFTALIFPHAEKIYGSLLPNTAYHFINIHALYHPLGPTTTTNLMVTTQFSPRVCRGDMHALSCMSKLQSTYHNIVVFTSIPQPFEAVSKMSSYCLKIALLERPVIILQVIQHYLQRHVLSY